MGSFLPALTLAWKPYIIMHSYFSSDPILGLDQIIFSIRSEIYLLIKGIPAANMAF